MKNRRFAILFGLVLMLCCFSCKKVEETIVSVDLGEGKYKEPFRGLLSSHPQWLVSTLDWPVLRSLRPDTLVLTKTIEIGFNEDAVRSHSTATIQFVDDSCNRLEGVKVYCNGKFVDSDGYVVEASSEPQLINIAYKIDPLKKEYTETGHFIISGVELDEVNAIKLSSDVPQNVADWTFTQKIGWPLMIWLIWLIMALLIIAIVSWLIYLLFKLITNIRMNNVRLPNPIGQEKYLNKVDNEGLSKKEKQKLKRKTGWPDEIIRYISSMEEAQIYIKAGLRAEKVGGRWALIRTDIKWDDYSVKNNPQLKNQLEDYDAWVNYNNADLIGEGYPPRQPNGDPVELHHIGQHPDSPLAELTKQEHHSGGNDAVLHDKGIESRIDRQKFDKEKSDYWKARYKAFTPLELKKIYG